MGGLLSLTNNSIQLSLSFCLTSLYFVGCLDSSRSWSSSWCCMFRASRHRNPIDLQAQTTVRVHTIDLSGPVKVAPRTPLTWQLAMCSMQRSICWQRGYFWNGEAMSSTGACKSAPVPRRWHVRRAVKGMPGGMLILSIKQCTVMPTAAPGASQIMSVNACFEQSK